MAVIAFAKIRIIPSGSLQPALGFDRGEGRLDDTDKGACYNTPAQRSNTC